MRSIVNKDVISNVFISVNVSQLKRLEEHEKFSRDLSHFRRSQLAERNFVQPKLSNRTLV